MASGPNYLVIYTIGLCQDDKFKISRVYLKKPGYERLVKPLHSFWYALDMVENYYNNARIRFATRNFTFEWQRVEKGIITGCTLSVVYFL